MNFMLNFYVIRSVYFRISFIMQFSVNCCRVECFSCLECISGFVYVLVYWKYFLTKLFPCSFNNWHCLWIAVHTFFFYSEFLATCCIYSSVCKVRLFSFPIYLSGHWPLQFTHSLLYFCGVYTGCNFPAVVCGNVLI